MNSFVLQESLDDAGQEFEDAGDVADQEIQGIFGTEEGEDKDFMY